MRTQNGERTSRPLEPRRRQLLSAERRCERFDSDANSDTMSGYFPLWPTNHEIGHASGLCVRIPPDPVAFPAILRDHRFPDDFWQKRAILPFLSPKWRARDAMEPQAGGRSCPPENMGGAE